MKKVLISVTVLLFVNLFNEGFAQVKPTPAKPKMAPTGAPHKGYSPDFAVGKSAHAQMILDLWKDWDDNEFDRHDYMADTLVMHFPDGTAIKGKNENMDAAKKYRGGIASVKSVIFACVPLTRASRYEDAVCIWGHEDDTYADGKVDSRDIHEVWWFNKAGKIIEMRQWTAKPGE